MTVYYNTAESAGEC